MKIRQEKAVNIGGIKKRNHPEMYLGGRLDEEKKSLSTGLRADASPTDLSSSGESDFSQQAFQDEML